MRQLSISVLFIISAFIVSCGGSSNGDSSNTEDKKDEVVTETVVLDSEDAMMAKLTEYKITVPENMVFRSVDKQTFLNEDFEDEDTYLVYFDSKDEEVNKDELLNWYNSQIEILKNNGWTEKSSEEDKEMMGGGTYNQAILVNESEKCTLDLRLVFMDNSASISIHPKYDIS